MSSPSGLEARLTGAQLFLNLLLAGFLGLFGAVSVLLFLFAGRSLTLLLCAAILGPIALLVTGASLFQYFSRRPTLWLDAEGLHHLTIGSIAWRDLTGVAMFVMPGRTEGIPMLALGLAPGARLQGGVPWSRLARPTQLRISLRGLDKSPGQILETARAFRDEVSPPRVADWYFGMSPERQAASRDNHRLLAAFERLAENAGRHDAKEEAELQQLTEELDGHTAELQRLQGVESHQFRRKMALAWVVLALAVLVSLALLFLSR
jgi:hypothetical protein